MKSCLILIFIFLIFLLSCSKSPENKAKEFIAHFCNKITNFSESNLQKASDIYDSLINSDEYLEISKNQNFKIALRNEIETCFRSIVFNKKYPIKALDSKIIGNSSQFLTLDTINNDITYLGDESTAFRIALIFNSHKKYNKRIANVEGKLTLLDSNKNKIISYNIHSTPDLINILEQGNGEAIVNTYLAPLWDAFNSNPFQLAASSLHLIENSVFYFVELNIFNENENNVLNKNSDKNTDDYIDSIVIED